MRRIFRIQAHLDRMPARRMPILREIRRLARRDANHPLDQVDAGDLFRDAMLDLQARVHFEEIERSRRIVVDELNRAGGAIADRLRPAVARNRSSRARVAVVKIAAQAFPR